MLFIGVVVETSCTRMCWVAGVARSPRAPHRLKQPLQHQAMRRRWVT